MRGSRVKQIRRLAKAEAEKQLRMSVEHRSRWRRLVDWWRVHVRRTHEMRQNPVLDWKRNHRFLKRYYKKGSSR